VERDEVDVGDVVASVPAVSEQVAVQDALAVRVAADISDDGGDSTAFHGVHPLNLVKFHEVVKLTFVQPFHFQSQYHPVSIAF